MAECSAATIPGRTSSHHDFAILTNGNFLLPIRSDDDQVDYLAEVSESGETVWQWFLKDHLEERYSDKEIRKNDVSHVNSVQELPDNSWCEAGDRRFRPENILVSARNLDTIFIVERESGEIVWKLSDGLDFPHEALMIEPGTPFAGHILVFDNGYHNRDRYRESEILRIDPTTNEVVWSYSDPSFYSPTGGIQQALPNGNLLITSTEGGRVFEIEGDGSVIWQWLPPYLPMRTLRYPESYSPRLAGLASGDALPVAAPEEEALAKKQLEALGYLN